MISLESKFFDLSGRISLVKIGNKVLETPALFPVVDPRYQEISPRELYDKFKFQAIITSAYLSKKGDLLKKEKGIHELLNYPGIIMMDSGAYQLMAYQDIDISETETIEIQTRLGTDIGVPLDFPILYGQSFSEAKERVLETIKRITRFPSLVGEDNPVNWTFPVQGGKHIELIEYYLGEIQKADVLDFFQFFALGSAVQVMINYDYESLVDMMRVTRAMLPYNRVLHLFGAGHPMMFALSVGMGMDTFDSAAYILMAKDNRYMTVHGTYDLNELETFPCVCPVCSQYTPKELRALPKKERVKLLAEHNLWVSQQEILRIKHAIREGSLWHLIEERSRAHPALYGATRLFFKYVKENKIKHLFSQVTIPSGSVNVFDKNDLYQPILQVAYEKIRKATEVSLEKTNLLIIPLRDHESPYDLLKHLSKKYKDIKPNEAVFLFHKIFGLLPIEYMDVFPVSQVIFWEKNPDIMPMHKFVLTPEHKVSVLLRDGVHEDAIKLLELVLGRKRNEFKIEEVLKDD